MSDDLHQQRLAALGVMLDVPADWATGTELLAAMTSVRPLDGESAPRS